MVFSRDSSSDSKLDVYFPDSDSDSDSDNDSVTDHGYSSPIAITVAR
jgi:hypothetical protein